MARGGQEAARETGSRRHRMEDISRLDHLQSSIHHNGDYIL